MAVEEPGAERAGAAASRRVPNPVATVRAANGVAKVAFTAVSEITSWGVGTAMEVTSTVVRRSMQGTPPREVLAEAESEVRDAVRRALGLPEGARRSTATDVPLSLREQGAALLRLSAGSTPDDDHEHPAFASMLAELTPDEARILRFLSMDGPQPSIDIRTGRPKALSQRVGAMLTLIGEHAGLRFPNRIQQYLTNLRRLGLIEHTREPVGNPNRYQLLEAQSSVRELVKHSGFGTKVIYRSVVLTGFGADFVHSCLRIADDSDAGRASGTH